MLGTSQFRTRRGSGCSLPQAGSLDAASFFCLGAPSMRLRRIERAVIKTEVYAIIAIVLFTAVSLALRAS